MQIDGKICRFCLKAFVFPCFRLVDWNDTFFLPYIHHKNLHRKIECWKCGTQNGFLLLYVCIYKVSIKNVSYSKYWIWFEIFIFTKFVASITLYWFYHHFLSMNFNLLFLFKSFWKKLKWTFIHIEKLFKFKYCRLDHLSVLLVHRRNFLCISKYHHNNKYTSPVCFYLAKKNLKKYRLLFLSWSIHIHSLELFKKNTAYS